ncbi:hypothetical protein AP9108_32780 [Arthrospira sp. PCC 9108]|nr:hypothetical protein AP9108_32780 [Arthrospira sp. PCC 9108]
MAATLPESVIWDKVCVWLVGVLAFDNLTSLPSVTVPVVVPKFLLNAVFLVKVGSLPSNVL